MTMTDIVNLLICMFIMVLYVNVSFLLICEFIKIGYVR